MGAIALTISRSRCRNRPIRQRDQLICREQECYSRLRSHAELVRQSRDHNAKAHRGRSAGPQNSVLAWPDQSFRKCKLALIRHQALADLTRLISTIVGPGNTVPQPPKAPASFLPSHCCLGHPKSKWGALERPSNTSHPLLWHNLSESQHDIALTRQKRQNLVKTGVRFEQLSRRQRLCWHYD